MRVADLHNKLHVIIDACCHIVWAINDNKSRFVVRHDSSISHFRLTILRNITIQLLPSILFGVGVWGRQVYNVSR